MVDKALQGERGRSGSDLSSGVITRPYLPSTILGQDYNSSITIDKIDHMINGDGQVMATWNAISLVIQQAEWDMVPYSDDPKDREIAEFAEDNIRPIWPEVLAQAVDYLAYGFMLFEPVYRVEDGKIWWDRLAPRLPWTVDSWGSSQGHVKEVEQYVWTEDGYTYLTIPGKKLIRLTNQQKGENFEGNTILRGAYKHWDHKNTLYNIWIIKHERFGVGIVVGTLPETVNDEEYDKYEEVLKSVRSNECGYIRLPRGVNIDEAFKIVVPEGGKAGAEDLQEAVDHHNIQISRSVLTQFINLGDTRTGSRSVAEDMSSLFLMALGSVVNYIGHVFTYGHRGENGALRELIDMNYGKQKGYPEWKCEKIKKDNSTSVLSTIAQLVQSAALVHDESLEKHVRRLVGVPSEDVPTESIESGDNKNAGVQPGNAEERPEDANMEDAKLENVINRSTQSRDRFPWEEHVHFGAIDTNFDTFEHNFITTWRRHLAKQFEALGMKFGNRISREQVKELASMEMPDIDPLAEEFQEIYHEAYITGYRNVKEELLRQTEGAVYQEEPDEDEDPRVPLLVVSAYGAAEALSGEVKASLRDTAVTMLATDESVLWDDLTRRASRLSPGTVRSHSGGVEWAYGFGRDQAAQDNAILIDESYYSAMLDVNTCSECARMDGAKRSETYFITPNPNCLGNTYSSGGNPCRCITVHMLKEGFGTQDVLQSFGE